MRGYPQFSFWISVALAKIYFPCIGTLNINLVVKSSGPANTKQMQQQECTKVENKILDLLRTQPEFKKLMQRLAQAEQIMQRSLLILYAPMSTCVFSAPISIIYGTS